MTRCPGGDHDFPDEDSIGAHCPEHEITLLRRSAPTAVPVVRESAGGHRLAAPAAASPSGLQLRDHGGVEPVDRLVDAADEA